jgi:hypothetical protein
MSTKQLASLALAGLLQVGAAHRNGRRNPLTAQCRDLNAKEAREPGFIDDAIRNLKHPAIELPQRVAMFLFNYCNEHPYALLLEAIAAQKIDEQTRHLPEHELTDRACEGDGLKIEGPIGKKSGSTSALKQAR